MFTLPEKNPRTGKPFPSLTQEQLALIVSISSDDLEVIRRLHEANEQKKLRAKEELFSALTTGVARHVKKRVVTSTFKYLDGSEKINYEEGVVIETDPVDESRIAELDASNINMTNHEGLTLLMIGAQDGREDFVKTLLDKGADPNIIRDDGYNALHAALIDHGIDESDDSGERDGEAKIKARDNIVRMLLATGANPIVTSTPQFSIETGWSALHYAVHYQRHDIIPDIIEAMIKTFYQAAHPAADIDKVIFKTLNHRTKNGLTPLRLAYKNKDIATCRLLLNEGALLESLSPSLREEFIKEVLVDGTIKPDFSIVNKIFGKPDDKAIEVPEGRRRVAASDPEATESLVAASTSEESTFSTALHEKDDIKGMKIKVPAATPVNSDETLSASVHAYLASATCHTAAATTFFKSSAEMLITPNKLASVANAGAGLAQAGTKIGSEETVDEPETAAP